MFIHHIKGHTRTNTHTLASIYSHKHMYTCTNVYLFFVLSVCPSVYTRIHNIRFTATSIPCPWLCADVITTNIYN